MFGLTEAAASRRVADARSASAAEAGSFVDALITWMTPERQLGPELNRRARHQEPGPAGPVLAPPLNDDRQAVVGHAANYQR